MKRFQIIWRHVCEDVIIIRAENAAEALAKAMNGEGDCDASAPVQSLSYAVYGASEEPELLADADGSILIGTEPEPLQGAAI